MDIELKTKLLELWEEHFDGAELPIVFYYTDEVGGAQVAKR